MQNQNIFTHGNVGILGIQEAIESLISINKEYKDEELRAKISGILYTLEHVGDILDESINLHFSNYLKKIAPQLKEGIYPDFNLWIGGDYKCNLPSTGYVYRTIINHYTPEELLLVTPLYLKKCPKEAEVIQGHISNIMHYCLREKEGKPIEAFIPILILFLQHINGEIPAGVIRYFFTDNKNINLITVPTILPMVGKITTKDLESLMAHMKQVPFQALEDLPWGTYRENFNGEFFKDLVTGIINMLRRQNKIDLAVKLEHQLLSQEYQTKSLIAL